MECIAMPTLEVPEKNAAQTRDCPIEVSTKVNGEKKETTITKPLPYRLVDAIAIYGDKEVFKRFIQSLVISLQAEARSELQSEGGEAQPRARAKYLEELGL
jgi:hypothetical protein